MTKSNVSTAAPRPTVLATNRLHNISAMMGGVLSNIAEGANMWTGRFIASLHETRRQQANEMLSRYQHLVYDADADRHFGIGRLAKDSKLPFLRANKQ